MRRMQSLDDAQRVRRTVEEIRIAEGDVTCTRADLRIDVREHDADGDDAELAVVDGHDRTMAAQMPASAAGLGVADNPTRSVGQLQRRVARQRWKAGAIRNEKLDPGERALRALR